MLNDGRSFFFTAPELMIYPGLCISIAVMGFNLLGDGLRDALDADDASHLRRVG
jgi:peptide/nickel transport system permease protein